MSKASRLFIGNIPNGSTEAELTAEFGAYGLVQSIEIKTKPNPLNNSVDTFGFVTLQADDKTVQQCIKEFKEQKYKGVYLNVSKAKESFLDRLKREREEADAQKRNVALLDPYKKTEDVPGIACSASTLPELPTFSTIKKEDESSSSESSESESDEEPETSVTRPLISKPEDGIVRKWNQETYIEHGKLKIIPITGQVKEVIDRSKSHQNRSEGRQLGEQARIADEKRKQGLSKLKCAYDQQKSAIKSALSGDSVSNKRKITFSDDEDDSTPRQKLSLFDGKEDEDGFEVNFAVRNQLTGSEGLKLHEIQTTYHADNRFRLDARFLEGADKSKADSKWRDKKTDKERRKQLEILSNVTGKTIMEEKRDDRKIAQMQRFDPSQKEKSSKNETKEIYMEMVDMEKTEQQQEDFKVSDQKFYSVSEKLMSSIKQNDKEFSVLSLFGRPAEDRQIVQVNEEVQDDEDEMKPVKNDVKFKYDSSDSEDEQQAEDKQQPEEEQQAGDERHVKNRGHENDNDVLNVSERVKEDRSWRDDERTNQRKTGHYSKLSIRRETFFFQPADTRFNDGRKFFGITCAPSELTADCETIEGDAGNNRANMTNIRQIFKKRRQREGEKIRSKSKQGFKIMKKKTLRK